MMYLRGLVLFLLSLTRGARLSIRSDDSHHGAQQRNNTLGNGLGVSAEVREAFLPGGLRMGVYHRAGPQAGALRGVSNPVGRRAGHLEPHSAARWFRLGPRRANVALQSASGPKEEQLPRKEDEQSSEQASMQSNKQTTTAAAEGAEKEEQQIMPINRADFPILQTAANPDMPLIYLDSGASSQKPVQVLEVMDAYYRTSHANVHRGVHALATRATEAYEKARDQVQTFINAARREEIVFTRGATDAINIVAMGWGQKLQPGDEIVLSVMEHHSNLVPWQLLAERSGALLKFAQLRSDEETLDVDHLLSLLTPRTKIVSIVHVSNTLGSINPIKTISQAAHKVGAVTVVDACQSVPHMPVDVQNLECDFLAASGHKMCGPTGIGFLYGKYDVLEQMPPVQGGGEMIDIVDLEKSTYLPPPARFEAGTPPIAEAVGLGAACEYLQSIGMQRIHDHERALGRYLYNKLSEIPGIRIYGPEPEKSERAALVAFNCDGVQASDLSFFLDLEGVAVRSGHHCTQPLHKILGASGSCRASCYFYNSQEEVDLFIDKLKSTILMFKSLGEN